MQFKIKRLTALMSLALVAGTASAGNLCGMGLPGMGCGQTAGMVDSTQHGWVGAQPSTSWSPPQQQSDLQKALMEYYAGILVPNADQWFQPYQTVALVSSQYRGCDGTIDTYLVYFTQLNQWGVAQQQYGVGDCGGGQ